MKLNEMTCYLQEGSLLKSAYLLTNSSSGVLVDFVKPSIRAFYAHGEFGRLHNILYDADCVELYGGRYGIYPYTMQNGNTYLPFRRSGNRSENSYQSCEPDNVKDNIHEVNMRGLTLYDGSKPCYKLPEFSVSLSENALHITVQFPAETENDRLHLPWYPLYDRYCVADEDEEYIEYYRAGYRGSYYGEDGFCKNVGTGIRLLDSFSRQANLYLCGEGGYFELVSRTLPQMGHAKYLSTDFVATSKTVSVVIQLEKQRSVMSGQFFYPCGENAVIEIAHSKDRKTVMMPISENRGTHTFVQGEEKNMVYYHYCAFPEKDSQLLDVMSEACLKLKWREGVCQGIPAKAFDVERLIPVLRANSVYCSHGMRILPLLCATGVRKKDIHWVQEAFDIVKRVAALSYQEPDGMIFTPLELDEMGNPGIFANACRPSDTGIIIGGLVYAADAFIRFQEYESAHECIVYGWRYAKTLLKMQCSNGEFYERYQYPSVEPSHSNRGTVNNWCMHVWNLYEMLKYFHMSEEASDVLDMIVRYVDSQLSKTPSILKVCGGGEDVADFGDALNTASTLMVIKYLLTKEEIYRSYAEQALKKSWLMACMYADMPEFFCVHGNSDLGIYYDQPYGVFSGGGMHDLTAIEAGLFAYHNAGILLGKDISDHLYRARMASFVKDNGGMYMVLLKCPNFYFREENRSEALMYGGVGVYAYEKETGGVCMGDLL